MLARPIGMGGAFTAVAGDINSVWYNPAGMANINKRSVMFTYSKPYLDLDGVNMYTGYASYAMPLKKAGSIAATWTHFNTRDLYTENIAMISYAYKFDILNAGLNMKYLGRSVVLDERTIDDDVFANGTSRTAFSADLGVLRQWNKSIYSGLMVKDINQPDVGYQATDKVPMEMRIGTAGSFKMVKPAEELLLSCDMGLRNKVYNVYLGGEMWFNDYTLAGRIGANKNEFSLGLSYVYNLAYSNFSINTHYSFSFPFYVEGSSGSHRLSLGFQF
ncbi:MAG: hypothetical protein ABII64_04615 [Elusimicrobiota bacterium]